MEPYEKEILQFYKEFRKIRGICEGPDSDRIKLDLIHAIADKSCIMLKMIN